MKKTLLGILPYFIGLLFFLSCQDTSDQLPPLINPNGSGNIVVISDEFESTSIVLAGSQFNNLIVSFNRELDGEILNFKPVQGRLPIIMEDDQGNMWDIFGYAAEGPRTGQRLQTLNSGMGFWFAFSSMYPGAEIYEGLSRSVDLELEPAIDWEIPTESVYQGSTLDAIPSIDDPAYVEYSFRDYDEEGFYVAYDDLIIGIIVNGEVRAYPHLILNWHEIVNDVIEDEALAVTYCPLTGTGKVWNRTLPDGSQLDFGVSGLLNNSNLMPFDRQSNSVWTQLEAQCVHGDLIGTHMEQIPFVETTWRTWQLMYPRSLVLSTDTGVDRDYTENPIKDYQIDHTFLAYPIDYDDDRLPRKERVHGLIIDGKAKIYQRSSF